MKNNSIVTRKKPASLHQQLITLFIAGIILTSAALSFIAIYQTLLHYKTQLIEEGYATVKQLSDNSRLALLVSSPENASSAIKAVLSSPIVSAVKITDNRFNTVIQMGNTALFNTNFSAQPAEIPILFEYNGLVHFIAPVISIGYNTTPGDESVFSMANRPTEVLGYANLLLQTTTLSRIVFSNGVNLILIALILCAIVAFIMFRVISRVTIPLKTLSETMRQYNGEESVSVPDINSNTIEIANIFDSYKSMLDKIVKRDEIIADNTRILEEKVSLRTAELVESRNKAVAANQLKNEFLANISHELRTPLQSIFGHLSMLESNTKELCSSEIDSDIQAIKHSSRQLLDFFNELLNYKKIEIGEQQVKLSAFSLDILLNEIARNIDPLATRRNNVLLSDVSCGGFFISSDKCKIEQIVNNLLSNACKYTKNGIVTLSARITDSDPVPLATISVRDTGCGIPEKFIDLVFEPFTRLEQEDDNRASGTGLGLTICKRLVHLLGGSINLISKEYAGTTVSVTLPVSLYTEFAPPLQPCDGTSLSELAKHLNILLVDDDHLVNGIVKRMLESEHHKVTALFNGLDGLSALQSTPFDIAILDLNMPGLSGLDVAIRYKQSGNNLTPIIILTADATQDTREVILKNNIAILYKPVDKVQLLQAVYTIVAGRPALATPSSIDDDGLFSIPDNLPTLNIHTVDKISNACEDSEYAVNSLLSLVNELLAFCKSLPVIINSDQAPLHSRLHRYKGTSITLGAERIAHICGSIDKRLSDSEIEEMDSLIDNFFTELSRLETAVNDYANNKILSTTSDETMRGIL